MCELILHQQIVLLIRRMLFNVVRSPSRFKTRSLVKLAKRGKFELTLSKAMSTEQLETQANLPTKVTAKEFERPAHREPKQKLQIVKRPLPKNFAPGNVNLQVLGTGSFGAPSSVYLFTDKSRYLFNCGEGTQRLAHEHKTKLSRLERIFVTRNTWPMIGGIPGLSLTVQDAGVQEISLHGPPHLDNILDSMNRFVVLRSLKMETVDATENTEIDDSVMTVKCVPLFRAESESTNNCDRDRVVIAYACKLKPRPGALSLEKCVAHGVKPGPLLGMLKNGIDVTLEDGTLVKSTDVSEPPEKPLSFLFLDIPSEKFLPELQKKFKELYDDSLVLLVHFSPANIIENNCFQNLLQELPEQTQHIYLNSTANNFSGYIAAQRLQYHLNQLNSRIFPLLSESTELSSAITKPHKQKKVKLDGNSILEEEPINGNAQSVSTLTNFQLRPFKGLDRSVEAKLNPSEYIEETQALEDFPVLLQKLKKDLSLLPMVTEETASYPKITFLGTGSCVPNKTRNVSAILMQSAADSYILLDCGEGTHGQIVRFFGKTQAEQVMRNLKAIYISHLHADHHIGLIGLIHERQRLLADRLEPKMLLFAPRQIDPWLRYYDTNIACISDAFKLIGNAEMLESPLQLADVHPHVELDSIQTCLVRHCPHSFGVRFTLKADSSANSKSISVTYSGDTMPCDDLVKLGHGTTILIHEATMEDDLVKEARLKMHSTISEAVQQGRTMQAEHILLTHFSQRYAKLPRMQNTSNAGNTAFDGDIEMRNVSIAFDNMHITLSDLEKFHILYPALRALFAEHAEELEMKALKRELKNERKRKLLSEN